MNFREAFRQISLAFERSGSDSVLFASMPPDDLVEPGIEVLETLARRHGLHVVEGRARDLVRGNVQLPGILHLGGGGYAVIVDETEAGELVCIDAGQAGGRAVFDPGLIGDREHAAFWSFEKIYLNDAADIGLASSGRIETPHWLSSAVRPFWRSYVKLGLGALFINLLALASPLFVMNVYDRVLPNAAISTLWVLATGVMIAFVMDFLLKTARAALIDYTGRKIDLKLAMKIFEKVMSTSLSARAMSTGEYASRVTQYEFVREFFTSSTIATLIDTAFIFVFVLAIFAIAGWLSLVPLAAVIIVIAIGLIAQQMISRRVAAAANESALRQALLVETIATGETIKSLRAEGAMLKRWRELCINSSNTSERIKSVSSMASNATQLVQQVVTVAIIVFGAYLFDQGLVTTGAIIASVTLSGRAVAPLGQLAMTLARMRQAMLSLKILDRIMDQPEDTPTATGFVNRTIASGDVRFEQVVFRYPNSDQNALDGVSFSIRAGERVGIIGRIGSGKTTLGRLLSRLYVAAEGKILFEGVDVSQFHPAEVRAAVAFAGQSSDLFSGSLKDNLLMAAPRASDEDLIAVSRLTGIDRFVTRHPRGFDMPVGENGCNLSSGQKQSVAIARLLLCKPKIVFLDEPSGAMDLASERQLIQSLRDVFDRETTVIISTHRHSMLELVERLIVIDNGRVIADGPRDRVIQALQQKAVA
ncbi:ATP-binding cassette subfamily C protein LapB [Hoeflea marina]|uniref:ATP-binding cassette subfamily C protein LapB n=1 Tax=Hoeflea marina TaxID=274592 RepID=A0A317PRP1_9HYPH|nr:type I secretion system permease/ATPase [Hoeflea marina]PWW04138.1 ATP-binding cassette subfamily C protein LapB [Hoeflea marina]